MKATTWAAMALTAVMGCDGGAEPEAEISPAGGKADDTEASDVDAEQPEPILLPFPTVTELRTTLRAFVSASADTRQELLATGMVRTLGDEDDCRFVEEFYGDEGAKLCEAGRLVVPHAPAELLPTVATGVAEVHALPRDGTPVDLGLGMMLAHLPTSTFIQPELTTLDGSRTEVVDVVRRIQLTSEGMTVWSRDPADPDGPPLMGFLEAEPLAYAFIVLPDVPPRAKDSDTAEYSYRVALDCLEEADCEFLRED